jgi:glucokinase
MSQGDRMTGVELLQPASQAQRPFFFGIDVGGTNIKFGLVDDLGRTIVRESIRTQQERGPEDAIRRMCGGMQELLVRSGVTDSDVAAVGLATPGTMDLKRGLILQPHNLSAWWNFPIRERLAEASGKRVAFANDANAAAYGEYWVGRGAEFSSIAFFTLGTGIGGGIILDGVSLDGEHSHGSEYGHTLIDYHRDARICGCGQRGHLEAYACAGAVVQRTEEQLAAGRESSLRSRLQAGEPLTPLMVAEEAEKDDPLAVDIVLETARYLAYGAVNIMHTVDPAAVIFGGAMTFGGAKSPLGRRFMDEIRREIHARCFPTLVGRTEIDFATLGKHAGYIGAAGMARGLFRIAGAPGL